MTGPWFFEPLLPLHYEMVSIDPPWEYRTWSAKGAGKSASAHYETMTDAEIFAMPVGDLLSQHALVMLWATAPRLPQAIDALRAWGVEYRSVMAWRKVTKKGKVRMGTGYRVRSTHELVVIGAIGNPRQSFVPCTTFDGIARQHSRKPDEFFALCDRIMPHARKADVFSREERPGWATFGYERGKFDALAD